MIWYGFGAVILFAVILFWAISQGFIGYMPTIEQLENPIDRYASQIIADDGVMLGSYSYSMDNRFQVKYSELSPELVQALIATEDNRFQQHSGIDVRGLLRAIIKRGLLRQKSGGGGSTITQQLAKQIFSPNASSFMQRLFQKPIEWVIAVRLEKYYTKEEIINMYLNKFDFLYSAVGIQSAARTYFNTTPSKLKPQEAALFVGMCKNPSYYNPVKYPEHAVLRRNTVIEQMYKYGYIDRQKCDSLSATPIELNFMRVDHKEGLAPYLREYLRLTLTAGKPDRSRYPSWLQSRFYEDSLAWETNPLYGWCNKNFKPNGKPYNIHTDGLKIYTTINSRMQQYAEDAVRQHFSKTLQPSFFREKKSSKYAPFTFPWEVPVKDREGIINRILNNAIAQSSRYKTMKAQGASDTEIETVFKTQKFDMSVFSWNGMRDTVMTPLDSIKYNKSFLRTAFMSMDSHTGYVKAYVGGIDFANFQYDMVNTGRRQIGSTVKPFVYSLAMVEGFTPCDEMVHAPQQIINEDGTLWTPQNSNKTQGGEKVTLQWGLQHSDNWVTVGLMKNLSTLALERLLRSFGMRGKIEAFPSMCLGTPEISVAEMVSAYTVFTNKGIRIEPLYVTRIEDIYGNTIASFAPQVNEVLPEDANYKILSMLKSVVDGGTANRLRYAYGLKAEMGGKTGTTQNQSDGWFIGFTPNLVSGCWVGGEEPLIHFNTMEGQGANVALPVFALYMKKVFADKELTEYKEKEKFDVPAGFDDPCSSRSRPNNNPASSPPRTSTSGWLDEFYD
ncbi:MAG: transglycosylase domain-containing protein [Tannerella sp.]|nr:transglycosylase domain-containing protein [Tannerella sp.]